MIQEVEPLLEEVVRHGRRVADPVPVEVLRRRRLADLKRLDPGVRRLVHPHLYHVSLSQALWDFKQDLTHRLRHGGDERQQSTKGIVEERP